MDGLDSEKGSKHMEHSDSLSAAFSVMCLYSDVSGGSDACLDVKLLFSLVFISFLILSSFLSSPLSLIGSSLSALLYIEWLAALYLLLMFCIL